MLYREFGRTGIQVSAIGLGGHEFGDGGKVRGSQDDFKLAVQRGHVFGGFGQENRRRIIPDAHDRGMAVFVRECFRKGQWFAMADDAGITDRAFVARCGIKWVLRDPRITAIMLGVANPEQLESNCAALAAPELNDEEQAAIAAILATDRFKEQFEKRRTGFKR